MITEVIQRYYPDWEPPPDHKDWNQCCCPFHGESNPSAAVSYDRDGFNCFACDVKGDAISIIRHEEGVSYAEALTIAEGLSVGSNVSIQRKPPRKSSRRVFGESGNPNHHTVRAGVRGRATPWS